LLGALSLATDAAAGFPAETAMRTAVIAVRLARAAERPGEVLRDAYYAGLLRYLGCTGSAREHAAYNGGDDGEFLQIYADVDFGSLAQVAGRSIRRLGRRQGGYGRLRSVARFLGDPGAAAAVSSAHCAAAAQLSGQIGLGPGVERALGEIYERFDGRGAPGGIRGADLGPVSGILHLAQVAEVHHRLGGTGQALAEAGRRAGGHFDPALARIFAGRSTQIFAGLGGGSVWEVFLDAEAGTRLAFGEAEIEAMALAFADFADLKSPWRIGHSRRVAELCSDAAPAWKLPAGERRRLRLAALLHDIGRVSVPNGILDKATPLTAVEEARLRVHPAETERILRRAPQFAAIAELAGSAHERLDGSGYPRRVPALLLGKAERLLAAADVFVALTSDRAHRRAFAPQEAARILMAKADSGKLDGKAAALVLEAAGLRAKRPRRDNPAGLTDREVEIMVLLAKGLSNRSIGDHLRLSPRTVQSHVMHIFDKTGIRSRAGAALFAVRHLFPENQHFGA
jgi:HD-GYP domain-containing protein (c-di-GMP phosphodiesterase class II)